MVQTPEAVAYREKIDEWLSALSAFELDKAENIQKDIVAVQDAMKFSKTVEKAGVIVTTVGLLNVPASFVYPGMATTIIGSVSTILGVGATYYGMRKNLNKKYLWASFGMSFE